MIINSNLRRKIRENRYKIAITIIGIILFLLLLGRVNSSIKIRKMKASNEISNTQEEKIYKPQETMVQGKEIPEEQQEKNSKLIEQFITFCNMGNVEEAYNMLSRDCKQEIYQSNIQNFKNQYVDRIFKTKKIFNIQSWIVNQGYTYKVTILDDMLATGKTENEIVDYYTIVYENDEYKLNINYFIKSKQIQRNVENELLKIELQQKNIYYEYEVYDFNVTNKINQNILLDTTKKLNSIYLVGENATKYEAYLHELDENLLIIRPNATRKIQIKFNKRYSTNNNIVRVVFSNIIKDYDAYKETNQAKEDNILEAIIVL